MSVRCQAYRSCTRTLRVQRMPSVATTRSGASAATMPGNRRGHRLGTAWAEGKLDMVDRTDYWAPFRQLLSSQLWSRSLDELCSLSPLNRRGIKQKKPQTLAGPAAAGCRCHLRSPRCNERLRQPDRSQPATTKRSIDTTNVRGYAWAIRVRREPSWG